MIRSAIRLGLGPILLLQGRRVRRDVLRLPEPDGAREGTLGIGPALSLLIIGDSAAAGVGVPTQGTALSGRLTTRLGAHHQITWRLYAKTGRTVDETLAAMDDAPLAGKFDVALISLGVNDVTIPIYLERYGKLLHRLRTVHGVRHILASAVPPIGSFPALPQPLRWYLGQQARAYDRALADWATHQADVQHLPFATAIRPSDMATDGFHPGASIDDQWAETAANAILKDRG